MLCSETPLLLPSHNQAAPAVAITPCLEVLCSVRTGDDPRFVQGLFRRMSSEMMGVACYRWPEPAGSEESRRAASTDWDEGLDALTVACGRSGHAIHWASLTFADQANASVPPGHSCTMALGWIEQPDAPRGISLRITKVGPGAWAQLEQLADELTHGWPGLIHWATVGPRFVPVFGPPERLAEGLCVIQGAARRFLAADVGDPMDLYASVWQGALRTVSWITIVGLPLAGQVNLTAGRLEHVEVSRSGGSWRLRAGVEPRLCDVNRRELRAPYQQADQLLRPVLAQDQVVFPRPWNRESTQQWLGRWEQGYSAGP